MKLVVLTNILTPYRIPLFEVFRQRTHEFAVLLMASSEEDRQWVLPIVSFKCRLLPGFHLKLARYPVSIHLNYGVIRMLRQLDPDIVLSGGYTFANIAACIYCKLFRKKYVGWNELILQDGSESSILRRLVRRWLTSWSDGSIAASSDARDVYIHYGARPEDILIALMPFDVNYFHEQVIAIRGSSEFNELKVKYPSPILLSIGQIIPRKGYHELFQIYEEVIREQPNTTLLIVGDGPDRQRCEHLVKEKGWKRVEFVGYVQTNELPKYLAVADVFIFQTLKDPFGLVLAEAMAAQLPVISSMHAAATRDLVENGVTGFVIDPLDAASASATVIHLLQMPPEERLTLAKAGYERVTQCDVNVYADKVFQFLTSVVIS